MRPMAKSAPALTAPGAPVCRARRFFELFGQIAACGDVGEDDIAGVAEEQIVEFKFFSESAGDM